jgi:hypothetical protein
MEKAKLASCSVSQQKSRTNEAIASSASGLPDGNQPSWAAWGKT